MTIKELHIYGEIASPIICENLYNLADHRVRGFLGTSKAILSLYCLFRELMRQLPTLDLEYMLIKEIDETE